MTKRERAQEIYEVLGELYPDARCELNFTTPLELLVATVLSAQSTDRGVNTVTPALFARYSDAAAYAAADRIELEELIRPTGFFHNKAAALMGIGAILISQFDGEIPRTQAELMTLPGVGRKTANVVLGEAFGIPALTTDTHVLRLSRRFGWTTSTKPEQVEDDIAKLFDKSAWNNVNQRVIWHGRRRCHARKPACGACPLAGLCPAYGEGPTDPQQAELLVREPRR